MSVADKSISTVIINIHIRTCIQINKIKYQNVCSNYNKLGNLEI